MPCQNGENLPLSVMITRIGFLEFFKNVTHLIPTLTITSALLGVMCKVSLAGHFILSLKTKNVCDSIPKVPELGDGPFFGQTQG